jgi:hypothetical protein
MNIQMLFRRKRTRPITTQQSDWASNFTPRDWADLPTHRPRRDDAAN